MSHLQFEMIFATHGVRVTRLETGEIRCWKYTNSKYDYEVFYNVEEAMDYITTAPPTLGWHVEITEC